MGMKEDGEKLLQTTDAEIRLLTGELGKIAAGIPTALEGGKM